MVDAMERCGNRRPRVERLVSAWNQGSGVAVESVGEPNGSVIAASAEPRRRTRTPLTEQEVDAMRTARAKDSSVTALAAQFGVHRATVWVKTRGSRSPADGSLHLAEPVANCEAKANDLIFRQQGAVRDRPAQRVQVRHDPGDGFLALEE